MKKVLLIFGTRPEAIKMAPVYLELKKSKSLHPIILVTGQHRELLTPVLNNFSIRPTFNLKVMKEKQDLTSLTANCLQKITPILKQVNPSAVLVHGDTTSALAGALVAFYEKIPLGHVEAGLRSQNIHSPFPEELNRKTIATLANFHFAPSLQAQENLLKEGICEKSIYHCGNTGIDALRLWQQQNTQPTYLKKPKTVLITIHRRENLGAPLLEICQAIKAFSKQHLDHQFIWPVHPNPHIKEPVQRILKDCSNVALIAPLDHFDLLPLFNHTKLIITDSGGIQEEASYLGVPLLIYRDETERPEVLDHGNGILLPKEQQKILEILNKLFTPPYELLESMQCAQTPYGNGFASQKIKNILEQSSLVEKPISYSEALDFNNKNRENQSKVYSEG